MSEQEKKVIEAMESIRDYCERFEMCSPECVFAYGYKSGYFCTLIHGGAIPMRWGLNLGSKGE